MCASPPPRRPASISRAARSTSGRSTCFIPAPRRSTPPSASARAPRSRPRDDTRIVIHRWTPTRRSRPTTGASCATAAELRLLSLLAHFFEARGITLTTSSESPAGAGIAGSSALNVAVCAALAEWNRTHYEPEALLQIAMNVEAQAINVPTGLQDYRPALYGGIAALELDVDGVRRVPLDVDIQELERRIVLCYTGEPRNSGTNNWEITKKHIDGDRHVFDCFERIRDTAAAMREALARGTGTASAARIAEEWDNRKRLAPGVTTPAIDDLIARASAPGATAAKVCGAGGGGCLFCYGPPNASAPSARRWPAAAPGCSTSASSGTGSRVDNRAHRAGARRDRRPARNQGRKRVQDSRVPIGRRHDRRLAGPGRPHGRQRSCARLPGIGKDLAAKIRELADTGTCLYHQELLAGISRRPFSTCCVCRASGRRPSPCSTRAEHPHGRRARRSGARRDGCATEGHGREERGADPEGRRGAPERRGPPPASGHGVGVSRARQLPARTRARVDFIPVGSLRRGCETCGDIDILAIGGDADPAWTFHRPSQGRARARPRRHEVERAPARRLPGRPPPRARESRGAAMQYFTGSKAHNIVLRDRAVQQGFKLNEYGLFRVEDDCRVAGETEEGIYEALGMAWIEPELRENRGEIEAAVDGRLPRLVSAPISAATCTCTPPPRRPRRPRVDGRRRAPAWPPLHRHHRSQQGAGDGERARRASRARACGAGPGAERPLRGPDAARGNRVRHPRRRQARSRGRLPGRSSTSSSHRCTHISARTRRR